MIVAEFPEALGIGNDSKPALRVSEGFRSQELAFAFLEQQQHLDDVVLVHAVVDEILEALFERAHAEGRCQWQQLERVGMELEDALNAVHVVENRLQEDGSEANGVRLAREIHVDDVIQRGRDLTDGISEVGAVILDDPPVGEDLPVVEFKDDIGGSAPGIEVAYHQWLVVDRLSGAAQLLVDGVRVVDQLLEVASYVKCVVLPDEIPQGLQGRCANIKVVGGLIAPQADAVVAQDHVPEVFLVDDIHGEQELNVLNVRQPRFHVDPDDDASGVSTVTVAQPHRDSVFRPPRLVRICLTG